jgi:hypothetical protein
MSYGWNLSKSYSESDIPIITILPYYYASGTKWGYKNSRGKCICCKICDLSNYHWKKSEKQNNEDEIILIISKQGT